MTPQRPLTSAVLRELFSYDELTGDFTRLTSKGASRKGQIVGHGHLRGGYRSFRVAGRTYPAHRLAWLYVYGEWPKQQIDHINGDRLDNRIANLRDVSPRTNSENQRNAHRVNKSSGLLGVHWHNGRWRAQISVNSRLVRLGRFDTAEEAHAAYVAGKRIHHAGCTL